MHFVLISTLFFLSLSFHKYSVYALQRQTKKDTTTTPASRDNSPKPKQMLLASSCHVCSSSTTATENVPWRGGDNRVTLTPLRQASSLWRKATHGSEQQAMRLSSSASPRHHRRSLPSRSKPTTRVQEGDYEQSPLHIRMASLGTC